MNQELIQFASVALPIIFICAMGLVVIFATAIDHDGTINKLKNTEHE